MQTKWFHNLSLVAMLSALAPHPCFASDSGFDGLWIFGGLKGSHDLSSSTVSYDYKNLYMGSLNSPGFSTSSTYDLKSDSNSGLPSGGLRFVSTGRSLVYGFSLMADRLGTRTLSTSAFNFPAPTGQPDQPKGFSMSTQIKSTFDLSLAFEPGFQMSETSLFYLKLSYHHMGAQVSTLSSVQSGLSNPVFTEASSNESLTGFGAGLGLRILPTDQISVDFIFDYVSFLTRKVPASSLTSTNDEVSVNQTQSLSPKWLNFGLLVGFKL